MTAALLPWKFAARRPDRIAEPGAHAMRRQHCGPDRASRACIGLVLLATAILLPMLIETMRDRNTSAEAV
jgi:hypothetical protein